MMRFPMICKIFVKKLEFDVLPLTKHLEFVRIHTSNKF